jgi:hypothetical protein
MLMPLYTIRHMLPTRDFRAYLFRFGRCRTEISAKSLCAGFRTRGFILGFFWGKVSLRDIVSTSLGATGISGRPGNRVGSLGVHPNCFLGE